LSSRIIFRYFSEQEKFTPVLRLGIFLGKTVELTLEFFLRGDLRSNKGKMCFPLTYINHSNFLPLLSSSVTLDRLSIPENNQHGLKAKFSWQGERQNNLAKSQLKRHIPTRSPVILDHTNPSVLSDSILNFAPSEWTNTRNQFQANQAVFQAEPEIITIDNINSILSSSHRRQPDTFAVDVQSSYQARTAGV